MAPVRLRSRPRRPRQGSARSHPFDAWTAVGNLDSPARVQVDGAGRAFVAGRGWILDWWIGAEDRWHRPVQEAAVRQQLVGASPVVETRVRIPSGDAVSRAYCARGPRGEDLLVVEVENDSKVPVALALVVEAHAAGGAVHDLALVGSELGVDGEHLWLQRSPGRFALSIASDERDAADVVLEGAAEPVRTAAVACRDGGAQGVLLFPLAHTATLRITVALDGSERPVDVTALPSPQQVASGWGSHSAGGPRLELPDRRLRDAVNASSRFLLLASDDPSLATIAARWRLRRERPAGDALGLAGLIEAWATSPSTEDRANGYRALPAIADLLEAMGEDRAAQDVRTIHRSAPVPNDLSGPYELLAGASPTSSWATERSGNDLSMNAALLLAVRDLLVDESEGELRLSPVVPDTWLGLGWEAHDLPTRTGHLSFAVRWHGERPALLWELEHEDGVDRPVRLTAPALDPSWSSIEPKGEALLAPVPVPERPSQRKGITIPVTIEPMRRP